MKDNLLAEILRSDWIGPVESLTRPADAGVCSPRWAGTAARPRLAPGNHIDAVRVSAMQAAIDAGCYAPDAGEVADAVLATIAPSRRH
jgi:hypothetical protein